jgi:hypothetical protein
MTRLDSICDFATLADARQFVDSCGNIFAGSSTPDADAKALAHYLRLHSGEGCTVAEAERDGLVDLGWPVSAANEMTGFHGSYPANSSAPDAEAVMLGCLKRDVDAVKVLAKLDAALHQQKFPHDPLVGNWDSQAWGMQDMSWVSQETNDACDSAGHDLLWQVYAETLRAEIDRLR